MFTSMMTIVKATACSIVILAVLDKRVSAEKVDADGLEGTDQHQQGEKKEPKILYANDHHRIDPHAGTVHVTHDNQHTPFETHGPLKTAVPDICAKINDVWAPMVFAKASAGLEAKLFHRAQALAQDLEDKIIEHKKNDHDHFDCKDAQDLLSKSSAKDLIAVSRDLLEIPVKGHTGESIENELKLMKETLLKAVLINEETAGHIDEVLGCLNKIHTQHDIIKKDYDAVVRGDVTSPTCKKQFNDFINTTLAMTHDDVPKWEGLRWGMQAMKDQCIHDDL